MVLPEEFVKSIKTNIIQSNIWLKIDKSKDFLGIWFATDANNKRYMLHFSNNEILIKNKNQYIRLNTPLLNFIKEQK